MESIGATHDAVLEEVRAAVYPREDLYTRAFPRRLARFMRWIRTKFPFFLEPNSAPFRERLEKAATSEEKANRYYAAVTGERFIEGLAALETRTAAVGALGAGGGS